MVINIIRWETYIVVHWLDSLVVARVLFSSKFVCYVSAGLTYMCVSLYVEIVGGVIPRIHGKGFGMTVVGIGLCIE